MTVTTQVIAGSAAITALIKAAGPVALGGRELPRAFVGVVALMPAALLAGLVVTQALADGRHLTVGAETAGVLAGGVLAWRRVSIVLCVVVAAAVTAALRAAGA